MLGKRSDQRGLWEADRLYLDYVGQDTFYGLLASLRGQLFSDDDFAEILTCRTVLGHYKMAPLAAQRLINTRHFVNLYLASGNGQPADAGVTTLIGNRRWRKPNV